MQKLEYDQAPGCDEQESALLFLAVEETGEGSDLQARYYKDYLLIGVTASASLSHDEL